ncbi:hypothetical protein ACFL4T_04025 [candidate division KSB1 bacterium]
MEKISIFTICILIVLFSSCSENPVSYDYSEPAEIEYTISGGLAGNTERTTIDKNGFGKLFHFLSGNEIEVSCPLQDELYSKLQSKIKNSDFFNLNDDYNTDRPVLDGFSYSITYSTENRTKTITAVDGAAVPVTFPSLFNTLREINSFIRQNSETQTLFVYEEYIIKDWPFSDKIRLSDNLDNSIYLNELDISNEVYNFFLEIRNSEDDAIFWEGDCLYRMRKGWYGDELQYIEPSSQHQLRYWPDETNIDINDIGKSGLVLEEDKLSTVQNLLSGYWYTKIFILGELKDGGKAVYLLLINGKPVQ